jgi:hypothetical protein
MKITDINHITSAFAAFAPNADGAYPTNRCLQGQYAQQNQQEWAEQGTINGRHAVCYYIFEADLEDASEMPFDVAHISHIDLDSDDIVTQHVTQHVSPHGITYYSTVQDGETVYSWDRSFENYWTKEDEPDHRYTPIQRTADVSVTLRWDAKCPYVLSIDGPDGITSEGIYFGEHDGTKMSALAPAFISHLPKGAKIESNNRNEAWVSHWDDQALSRLDGRTFWVRYRQLFDADENWIGDSATLID